MKIYTIGDLHLSHQVEKPMDVFGEHWLNHADKIKKNWNDIVEEQDVVIMPGDFSWATYLDQAEDDFRFLGSLPGAKILLKGNHDYWWETVTKMKKFLNTINVYGIDFLHNNSHCYEGVCFCGTKGWDFAEEKDEKIINREITRFKISLDSAAETSGEIIAVFHYPPDENRLLLDILKEKNIKKCIYGHKHGYAVDTKTYFRDGIEFINASADQLQFTPLLI